MKIVFCNRFSYCVDNAYSSYLYYQRGEVKMIEMFIILLLSVGGAYAYGYLEGETHARERIFGETVKKVDRKRRRY